jgi:hypothetical protein
MRTTEHLLLLTLHQIAADSYSVMVFFRELWNFYTANINGPEPELPLLPIQYGDFARWQRRGASGEAAQSQRKY